MRLTKEYLATIPVSDRRDIILKEYIRCKFDLKYCIETYFTVLAGNKRIPFDLFPHQIDAFNAYEEFSYVISLKSRQMGLSVFTAVYCAAKVVFNNNFKILLLSKTMTDSKGFLKLIKDMLDEARMDYPWLVPDYLLNYNNKESFTLTTGSMIKAESTSDDAGRGLSPDFLVIDECAFVDRRSPGKMKEIWAAVSPALAATKGKAVLISTPKGSSGFYYETFLNAKERGFKVINSHWTVHPIYNQGTYQWIVDNQKTGAGHVKFYGKPWPKTIFDKDAGSYIEIKKEKYPFICDGKVRSPWYDMESGKLGPRLTASELDCTFVGTGGEVLDADMLRDMKIYSDSLKFTNPFESLKGIYRNYREYKAPIDAHKYVVSADVATGDGSDFSAFVVLDMTTLEIVATYKEQLLTATYAIILEKVARRYNVANLVVENAGGGESTLQELKRLTYPHIYYSILQKKDPSTGMKKRKIGLWASADVRLQGGDKLEEVLRMRNLLVPCEYLVSEFYNWIWDKDGKRRHAPEKNDDIIMALQHGIWFYFYWYKRSERNMGNFQKMFEVQRNGESIRLEEDNRFVKDELTTQYSFINPGTVQMSGNLDKMIDTRILSPQELKSRSGSNSFNKRRGGNKRTFI